MSRICKELYYRTGHPRLCFEMIKLNVNGTIAEIIYSDNRNGDFPAENFGIELVMRAYNSSEVEDRGVVVKVSH